MAKSEAFIIGTDGTFRAVYSPLAAKVAAGIGDVTLQRASNVEPTAMLSPRAMQWLVGHTDQWPDCHENLRADMRAAGHVAINWDAVRGKLDQNVWWADLTPVGGPVLGPYPTASRDQALADEVKWLHDNNIPTSK